MIARRDVHSSKHQASESSRSGRGARAGRRPWSKVWPSALLAAVLLSCGGASSQVRCSNGGECRRLDEKYRYCLESRCVECVSSTSCGRGRKCIDGSCQFAN